ncbi:hypothetical protein HaLaN_22815, partial [Haematococcus lacustris]
RNTVDSPCTSTEKQACGGQEHHSGRSCLTAQVVASCHVGARADMASFVGKGGIAGCVVCAIQEVSPCQRVYMSTSEMSTMQ